MSVLYKIQCHSLQHFLFFWALLPQTCRVSFMSVLNRIQCHSLQHFLFFWALLPQTCTVSFMSVLYRIQCHSLQHFLFFWALSPQTCRVSFMSVLSGSVLQRHETVGNLVHHYIYKRRFFTFLEYSKPMGSHAMSEL